MFETTIHVVGFGKRKVGSGKNGPYDFVPVHFTYADNNVNGYAAAECNVDTAKLEKAGIKVGCDYDVIMSFKFFRPAGIHFL